MFDPDEIVAEPTLLKDLDADIKEESATLGPVEKVGFQTQPRSLAFRAPNKTNLTSLFLPFTDTNMISRQSKGVTRLKVLAETC